MKSSIDSPDPEVSEKKRNKKMPIGSNILIDNPQQKFSNVKYLSTPKLINEGSFEITTSSVKNHLVSSTGYDRSPINSPSSSRSSLQSDQRGLKTIRLGLDNRKKKTTPTSSNSRFNNFSPNGFKKSPIKSFSRNSTSDGKSNMNFQGSLSDSFNVPRNFSSRSPVELSKSKSHQSSSFSKDRNSSVKMSKSSSINSAYENGENTSTSSRKDSNSPMNMSKRSHNYSACENDKNISTSSRKDRTSLVKISQSEPDYSAYGNGEDSSSDEDASEGDSSDAFESVDGRSKNLEINDSDKPQKGSEESSSDENESDDNLFNGKQSSKKRKVSKSPRKISKKTKNSSIRRVETSKIKYADWSKERQFESSFEPDMESSEMIKLQRSACVEFINKDYAHTWFQSQSNGRYSP
jgi:hypothetical protein